MYRERTVQNETYHLTMFSQALLGLNTGQAMNQYRLICLNDYIFLVIPLYANIYCSHAISLSIN